MESALVARRFRTNDGERHEQPSPRRRKRSHQHLKSKNDSIHFTAFTSTYSFLGILCSNRHRPHTSTRRSTRPLPTSTYADKNNELSTHPNSDAMSIAHRDSGACRPLSSSTCVSKPMGFFTCHISLMSLPTRCVKTKSATNSCARGRSLNTNSESIYCAADGDVYTHSRQLHPRKRRTRSSA